ncbi:hypothetical protein, partial [Phocaeicola sp.]|uniref:hypothetical protein n=1 Tax=Phocaeicola sp. TaxID=2773926 RepID=UPI00307BD9DA
AVFKTKDELFKETSCELMDLFKQAFDLKTANGSINSKVSCVKIGLNQSSSPKHFILKYSENSI